MIRWIAFLILVLEIAPAYGAQLKEKPDFQLALKKVILPHEGGWVNDPRDRGKETYKGIARAFYPKWQGWKSVDDAKASIGKQPKFGTSRYYTYARSLNRILASSQPVQDAVAAFYLHQFWEAKHLGECRLRTTAERWIDGLVNNGDIAAIWMKKAVNRAAHKKLCNEKSTRVTSADIKALNAQRQDRVLFWFAIYRGSRYDALAADFDEYTDTWADREIEEIIEAVHDCDELKIKASDTAENVLIQMKKEDEASK